MTSALRYAVFDVFTTRAFAGNPLAVVWGAEGLETGALQAIAREFNFSESTFVLPPKDPANTAQVRIFTPTGELPFAGHPNVGTAIALAEEGAAFGRPIGDAARFEELAGLVAVNLTRDGDGRPAQAEVAAPEPFRVLAEADVDVLAPCIGLAGDDFAATRPVFGSVGLPFALAELASVEALGRARPSLADFENAVAHYGFAPDDHRLSMFVFARQDATTLRARMFGPLSGIVEDPATGSASGALGGWLARLSGQDEHVTIRQGVEMGRPSEIFVTARHAPGGAINVSIAGAATRIMRGEILL